jgi:hypothetical protein
MAIDREAGHPSDHALKNAAQLEKPFVMAGVAYAATQEKRAQRGLGKYPCSKIGG